MRTHQAVEVKRPSISASKIAQLLSSASISGSTVMRRIPMSFGSMYAYSSGISRTSIGGRPRALNRVDS